MDPLLGLYLGAGRVDRLTQIALVVEIRASRPATHGLVLQIRHPPGQVCHLVCHRHTPDLVLIEDQVVQVAPRPAPRLPSLSGPGLVQGNVYG